jgi:diaminohydroxyphosphoribosylaminopyrimidine deaminase/5-amino-6-(5-phosphoribosylamino)uracil reductase
MDDRDYMNMAIDLAKRGAGFTSPNPMVGAVIVKDGQIVGRGYHENLGGAHAEINAINDAGESARGATLYVNLEPCNHTGRTPPCTEKILEAGIKRVVVAMKDPNPDVKGGGAEYLKDTGIDVQMGICEDEARKLNEAFIKFASTKQPFVTIKCAATLDGRIATKTGDSRWVSNDASRRFVHRLRHASDAIMVGVNTVKKDDPALTSRLDDIKGKDPVRFILDTRFSIPEKSKVLRPESESDTIVIIGDSATGPDISNKRIRIEKNNVKVISSPERNDLIDLKALMALLGTMGMTSLLIEGGSRVIASSLSTGIVDKAIFFYAPKILGGDDGVPMCKGPGPTSMAQCIQVEDIRVRQFDSDVMIEGYIHPVMKT